MKQNKYKKYEEEWDDNQGNHYKNRKKMESYYNKTIYYRKNHKELIRSNKK